MVTVSRVSTAQPHTHRAPPPHPQLNDTPTQDRGLGDRASVTLQTTTLVSTNTEHTDPQVSPADHVWAKIGASVSRDLDSPSSKLHNAKTPGAIRPLGKKKREEGRRKREKNQLTGLLGVRARAGRALWGVGGGRLAAIHIFSYFSDILFSFSLPPFPLAPIPSRAPSTPPSCSPSRPIISVRRDPTRAESKRPVPCLAHEASLHVHFRHPRATDYEPAYTVVWLFGLPPVHVPLGRSQRSVSAE